MQLENEGIMTVEDLVEFNKYTIQQVADSLRRPGGATIPKVPFVFGENPQKRLLTTCDIVRYYETTGQGITTSNILWNMVIKNFDAQWKVLKERKTGDKPYVPKTTKALPVIKCTHVCGDYLYNIIGHRTITLSYIVQE